MFSRLIRYHKKIIILLLCNCSTLKITKDIWFTFFMHSGMQKNLNKVYLLRSVGFDESQLFVDLVLHMFQKQFNDKGPIKLQRMGIN